MHVAAKFREHVHDMLLPSPGEETTAAKYRTAAWLRFCFVIPLLYGYTLYSLLRVLNTGTLSPFHQKVIAGWIVLAAANVALNLAMLFARSVRACGVLSMLCIADELSSNEIVVYLTGVAASHALIFIVIAVAIYRVYFDYRQGLFSALYGMLLHIATVALLLGGALPEPPVRYVETAAVTLPELAVASTVSLAIGVAIAFSVINLGMGKLRRMRKQIAENWKRDLDSIERFTEQAQDCADEGAVFSETVKALLYATPFREVALLELDGGKLHLRASNRWTPDMHEEFAEKLLRHPPAGNEMAKIAPQSGGERPVFCFRLDCPCGNPVYLAVCARAGREPDAHRRSMLLNIAQSAGGALSTLRKLKSEKERSYTDGLTGLYNKRYFLEQLPAWLEEACSKGEPACVAVFDIDNFKAYNDDFGHMTGDELLRSVAHTFTHSLREGDVAVRFGGEEFLALIRSVGMPGGAAIAERMRAAVEQSRGTRRPVTVSGGVAAYPSDATDGVTLVECADNRLYMAKRTGKNKICIS